MSTTTPAAESTDLTASTLGLQVEELSKSFQHRGTKNIVRAVDRVTFSIPSRGSMGLVGESGSGKTTVARCILRLTEPSSGSVRFRGTDLGNLSPTEMRRHRRHMQMVFQDPYDSLNPRWTAFKTVEEPLRLHTDLSAPQRHERVLEALEKVRLDQRFVGRYPHELSGGQQQRVGIARAVVTSPGLLVLDEPTSALDALTRVEILTLLNSLRDELGLMYLFISHDFGSVRAVSDRIAVMYFGQIVEEAPAEDLFDAPQHPYSRALLSALLKVGGTSRGLRVRLPGEPPSPLSPPTGCRLHLRCPVAVPECSKIEPSLEMVGDDRRVACLRIVRRDPIEWPQGW